MVSTIKAAEHFRNSVSLSQIESDGSLELLEVEQAPGELYVRFRSTRDGSYGGYVTLSSGVDSGWSERISDIGFSGSGDQEFEYTFTFSGPDGEGDALLSIYYEDADEVDDQIQREVEVWGEDYEPDSSGPATGGSLFVLALWVLALVIVYNAYKSLDGVF